jgi:penicillin-binding protein 1C
MNIKPRLLLSSLGSGFSHSSAKRKVAFVAAASLAGVVSLLVLLAAIFPLPPLKPYSLVIEDRNGQFLHAFLTDDGAWRLRTSPHEIPERLKRILIEKEDKYFYYHPGVNPFALARAAFQNIGAGTRKSGASTITMQIARMLERKERTYINKLIEMVHALQLELRYSKNELLELYLSMVPLGGNIEGLKSASLIYYQTPPERLNIAQLFDLILIPNDPNALQPDKNPERLLADRKRRALPWIARGFFTKEDSIVLWQTDARAARKQLPRRAPHFALRLQSLQRDSSHVRSSLDLTIQKTAEMLLSNHVRRWKQFDVHNGAVFILDNVTKEVVAYVGSADFNDSTARGQVDAVKAISSPGSTLKPFLFAMQMERGMLTPRTRMIDTPYDIDGYIAENYDGTYSGLVFAEDALRRSLNVPFIRLLRDVRVEPFVEFAAQVGFASLQSQKDQLGLSVVLGGCGVSLEELVGAYATFASGGVYAPPSFVHQAKPARGTARQVFSSSTAFMVTDILSSLDRPDLPNNFESAKSLPKIAFKTGTSYGRRDAWMIGYSSEYTAGVWIGNVTRKGSPELVGSKAAAPLVIDIFNAISKRHQKIILPRPKDVGIREVCANSGLLPTPRCHHRVDDLYSISRSTTRRCEVETELLVSRDGAMSFCPSCVGTRQYRTVQQSVFPAELASFWTTAGVSVPKAPPHNPGCVQMFAGDAPTIVGLANEMTYYLVPTKQQLALQANAGLDVRELMWYVNETLFGRTKAGEKLFVSLAEGTHTLTCLDDKGRMSAVQIKVKHIL